MKQSYFAKRKRQLVPTATILIGLAISTSISAQNITTFDAPGAGTGVRQGTYALCINPSGMITGFSRDANDVRHGFIRSRNGRFTIFDAPGAGTAASQGTRAYSINPSGTITGFFSDSANTAHGYVRSNQGVFTVFDAPGAGTGPGQGTFPLNSPQLINANGAITGYYVDSALVRHGFVRDENGVITTFDAPGAGTGANQGTQSFAISPGGKVTGFYFDGTNAVHGFLRDKNGVITTFDLPGAGTGFQQGTYDHSLAEGNITRRATLIPKPKAFVERRASKTTNGSHTVRGGVKKRTPHVTDLKTISGLKVMFEEASYGEGPFYQVRQDGRTILVTYNREHPFWRELVEHATEPKVVATLDYLVFAMANAELLVPEQARIVKENINTTLVGLLV